MARPRAFFPYKTRTWLRNRRYLGRYATRPSGRNFSTAIGDVYPRGMLLGPRHNLDRLFVSGYRGGRYYDPRPR